MASPQRACAARPFCFLSFSQLMSDSLLFRNVRVASAEALSEPCDVLIENGRYAQIGHGLQSGGRVVDGTDRVLLPGLFDMHTHLREPGREDAETLLSGTEAAINGGFTGVMVMPDTHPVLDNGGQIQSVMDLAGLHARIPVSIAGAITKGLNGEELAAIGDMRDKGARMITDSPRPVRNPQVLRRALQYSRDLDVLVSSHCEVPELSGSGSMNDGRTSYRLGLPGLHPCSEEIGIARDLRLAQSCRARIHIQHLSTARAAETLARYRMEGLAATSSVTPHHLIFTDEAVGDYDTNMKVNPPLRLESDRQRLLEGLRRGEIDVIATDHSPWTGFEKERDFATAPFGMTGLDTALPALHHHLILNGDLSWPVLVAAMSARPRRILGLNPVEIAAGHPANCVLFNPGRITTVTREFLQSRSTNTPFLHPARNQLTGCVELVMLGARVLRERRAAGGA